MIMQRFANIATRRSPVPRRVPVLVGAAVVGLALSACSGSSTGDAAASAPSSSPVITASGTATPASADAPATTVGSVATASGSGSDGGASGAGGPVLCTPTVMTFTAQHVDQIGGREIDKVLATNASRRPCITTGYPGVDVIGRDGSTLASATRNPQITPQTLTVQPGQTVTSVITADATKPFADCPRSTAILFTMPDNTDSTRLTLDFGSCDVVVNPLSTAP